MMVVALVENLLDLGTTVELKSYPSLSVIEYKFLENFLLQLMNLNIFIYLFPPGLSCGTRDLQLHHGGGIWLPEGGLNPGPLLWEYTVLATGPPGRCLQIDVL